MACHDMSCHVMPCHVMSCHVMSCHAMPCHVMSCDAMPCHAMQCHVRSCHAKYSKSNQRPSIQNKTGGTNSKYNRRPRIKIQPEAFVQKIVGKVQNTTGSKNNQEGQNITSRGQLSRCVLTFPVERCVLQTCIHPFNLHGACMGPAWTLHGTYWGRSRPYSFQSSIKSVVKTSHSFDL